MKSSSSLGLALALAVAITPGCASDGGGTTLPDAALPDVGALPDARLDAGPPRDSALDARGTVLGDVGPMPDATTASCSVAGDCDDSVSCTADSCEAGFCVHSRATDVCVDADGLFCNGGSVCAPEASSADPVTGCAPVAAPDCGDGLDCTLDSCDEDADACANAPSDAACDDGTFCTGIERCAPGAASAMPNGCVPGTPPSCDDGVACTTDTCDPATDACAAAPADAVCSNDTYCDGVERCAPTDAMADARGCAVGAPVACDDALACTDDFCVESSDSCSHLPVDTLCDDGLYCDGIERCMPGSPAMDARGCEPGLAIACASDGFACTTEACDEARDICSSIADSSRCGPTEVCSASSGDPASGCTTGRSCTASAECDDGDVCNGAETCGGGICRAGTRLVCDDGVACTADTCDPVAGCDSTPEDVVCSDRVACNGVETCDATLGCRPGTAPVCNDGISCTTDACSEAAGGCTYVTSDAACSNGTFCDGVERCSRTLGCVAGTPPSCADSFACTDDSCDGAADACLHAPVSARCNDGAYCNGAETCSATLGCVPGAPVMCNDGLSCSIDACNEAVDACNFTYDSSRCGAGEVCTGAGCAPGSACTGPTASVCDDGQFCSGVETCSSSSSTPGVCQGGTPVVCDDGVACTVDFCSNSLGACSVIAWDRDADGYSDLGCLGLGTDCDDLDPSVHPGVSDDCDGIDNDCDGLIDGGLVASGGSCSAASQCCTGACNSSVCTLPTGSCSRTYASCSTASDCCSGLCARTVDGTRRCQPIGGCSVAGTACTTAADCCSSGCVGGVCSDTASCATVGASCTTDAQCCSNDCTGGTCRSAGPGCQVSGETCSSAGNCCSGFCVSTTTPGVSRCATHDTCRAEGEICTGSSDCCTGGCDGTTGRCTTLGSCSSSGEPCTGVRDCCSALCADGGSGVAICQHLPGCRPYGEICTAPGDCCSAECSPPDAVGVRRCVNPPGCVDAGEICGQGGSDNCCVLRHLGCTPTGLGVSRCNDNASCLAIGDTCEFAEQCCSGALCVLDSAGVRRCGTMCIMSGGGCLAASDCCAGNLCDDAICIPGSGGCAEIGTTCGAGADCCSGICTSGICTGL